MKKKILSELSFSMFITILGISLLLISLAGFVSYKPGSLLLLVSIALGVKRFKNLKGYTFTLWVFVCAVMAMFKVLPIVRTPAKVNLI
jgi:uncharacterized BrkB/YihY/UPF0761 family membrane protein